MSIKHIDCPCWATGEFKWSEGCLAHLVEFPHRYSIEQLERMVERRRADREDDKLTISTLIDRIVELRHALARHEPNSPLLRADLPSAAGGTEISEMFIKVELAKATSAPAECACRKVLDGLLAGQKEHWSECYALGSAAGEAYTSETRLTEGVIQGIEYSIQAVSESPCPCETLRVTIHQLDGERTLTRANVIEPLCQENERLKAEVTKHAADAELAYKVRDLVIGEGAPLRAQLAAAQEQNSAQSKRIAELEQITRAVADMDELLPRMAARAAALLKGGAK